MQNFPDIKDDQRFILEAELFFSDRDLSGKEQRMGQGRNSACHKASLQGYFWGQKFCAVTSRRKMEKNHIFKASSLKKP